MSDQVDEQPSIAAAIDDGTAYRLAPAGYMSDHAHAWAAGAAAGYDAAIADAVAAVESDDRPAWHPRAVVESAIDRAAARVRSLGGRS